MNFFDPTRPKTASGHPAILLDGSALPHITFIPMDSDHVELSIHLRNYLTSASYSYSYYSKTIPLQLFGDFCAKYLFDPEATLYNYFNWTPQSARQPAGPKASLADLGFDV